MRAVILAGLAAAVLAPSVTGLNAIGIKGQEFVDGVNGQRFQLVGIDYQPGGSAAYKGDGKSDVLSDSAICRRDAAIMQRIGVNTLRVYNLDPSINHDECASIFNAAGIYMAIDVNSPLPNESINELDPGSSYHKTYLERAFKLIDNFRGYPNTLAFFSANELVLKQGTGSKNPPYIRAVTRDLHQYQRARGGRVVPVGYAAADVRDLLEDTNSYLSCAIDGEANNDSKSDFIGVNTYSWCGADADFKTSKYDELASIFSSTTIPVFLSEYGCNEVAGRSWNEIGALYNPKQMPTFSGGLVYEYTQEAHKYGLVHVDSASSVSLLDDYETLAAKFATVDKTYLTARNETAINLPPTKCDRALIKSTAFASSFELPKQPSGVAQLIRDGAGGVKGKLVPVDLSLPSDLQVKKADGARLDGLKLEQRSSSDELGDTLTPASAGGSGASGSDKTGTASASAASANAGGRVVVSVGAVVVSSVGCFFFLL